MFGLTKREQRWKAEQQAAEVLAAFAAVALRAAADARIAEAKTDAKELETIRAAYNELLFAVGSKYPGETRHETALRYIRQAEERSECGAIAEVPNARNEGRAALSRVPLD